MNLQQWHEGGDYFMFHQNRAEQGKEEHHQDTPNAEGHRIFYRVEGPFKRKDAQATSDVHRHVNPKKAPLLFIHGYPTSSWDWAKIWPTLSEHYDCITLDMLGFGYSDKPNQAYTIREQADIYCALLKKLNIEGCHIISHDYGDTVAQELLARFNTQALPFTLHSLTLLNGGLFPETHHPVLMQKLLISPLGGLLVRLMNKNTLGKTLTQVFGPNTPPTQQDIDEFWQLISHKNGHRVMHRLIHYMVERKTYRERWVGALQQTTVPVRLIDGMLDPISGGHMVQRYKTLIPQPDVVCLNDVGHYPQVEAPEQVIEAIMRFLQSVAD